MMVIRAAAGRVTRSRTGARAGAALAGALVAVGAWALFAAVGNGLRQPVMGSGAPPLLGPGVVAVVSLGAGLVGWAALAVTERVLRRPRPVWLALVLTGLGLSLGGPMSGAGIGAGDRLGLALLHVAVAGAVIPLLYRTAVRRAPGHPGGDPS